MNQTILLLLLGLLLLLPRNLVRQSGVRNIRLRVLRPHIQLCDSGQLSPFQILGPVIGLILCRKILTVLDWIFGVLHVD